MLRGFSSRHLPEPCNLGHSPEENWRNLLREVENLPHIRRRSREEHLRKTCEETNVRPACATLPTHFQSFRTSPISEFQNVTERSEAILRNSPGARRFPHYSFQ